MNIASRFPEITKRHERLAPYTHLKIGGPAEYFVQPRNVDDLKDVLTYCKSNKVPLRMLGGGFNLLVREEPIPGVVMRLSGPGFSDLSAKGTVIRSSGGTNLLDLISLTIRSGLGGLETLIGIRGSVGGSVRCNVGDRTGEIGSSVSRVAVLHDDATEHVRQRDELTFDHHRSDLDEPVILWVEFELTPQPQTSLLKRMRKAWIARKATEPLSYQSAVRMFRDPPGQSAALLIEKAGMSRQRHGAAEISDRNANYVIAHPGTTSKDILTLIDMIRDAVRRYSGLSLDQELNVW